MSDKELTEIKKEWDNDIEKIIEWTDNIIHEEIINPNIYQDIKGLDKCNT